MSNRDYNTPEDNYNRKPHYETAEDYNKAHRMNTEGTAQQFTNTGNVNGYSGGRPLRNPFAVQMVFAIVEFLLFCFSPVTAILAVVAMVFAIQANSAYSRGNDIDFQIKSKVSSILLIVSGCVMTVSIIVTLIFAMVFINSAESIIFDIQKELENDFGEWKDYLEPVPEPAIPDYEGTGAYTGELSDGDMALPAGFETFTLNGKTYSLPMTYEDFKTMGYNMERGFEGSLMEPDTGETITFLNDYGYMVGSITVANHSSIVKPFEECMIESIYLNNDGAYDNGETLDLVFGDGFTVNTTFEELESYLGAPCYTYYNKIDTGEVYEDYSWYYLGDKEYHDFYVSYINGEISTISIGKQIY